MTPLNPDQQAAFDAIKTFMASKDHDTFILKGYAGTGKTYLLQYLAQYLTENKIPFKMMATTGRAAAVLRGKTQINVTTVHGELYNFSQVSGIEETESPKFTIEANRQLALQFSLRHPDNATNLYIVDEASMLASETGPDTSYALFGSGMLLGDLFHATEKNKILFSGDPCQLPPIAQSMSPALHEPYLGENYRKTMSVELKTIVRTKADNEILKIAEKLRNKIYSSYQPKWPTLPALNKKNALVYATYTELLTTYLEHFKNKDRTQVIAIANSNAACGNINRKVRQRLYGDPLLPLQKGEILLVTQNNYQVPLFNGDFVELLDTGMEITEAGLKFIQVRVKKLTGNEEYEILLAKDILTADTANLTKEQQQYLLISFTKKMAAKNIRPNTPQFLDSMKADRYLNSLRAVYGYAVTCHKAQGGEWDDVFLFLNRGMFANKTTVPANMLRWWYTAVTRSKERLHLHYDWWLSE